MSCANILNMIYEDNDNMPLINQIQINIHTFFCSSCAREAELYYAAKTVMKEDFLPSSPDLIKLENSIMAKIYAEEEYEQETESSYSTQGILSTRGWVIAGIVLMVSLVTAFFGFDFKNIASESGSSFLLPFGITIGIILTIYGALFIGSHLKELSERFGL
ncbi:MAG: peptidoglycan-binding protein [Treponema sp.]|nr:peptidoglycan-binding protein [Treponema sp.]